MDIQIQFQVILTSFLFGFLFMIIYDLLNCFLYKKKGKIIRLFVETLVFLLLTLLYFILMLNIYNAKLNIYIPLFVFLGIIVYMFTVQSSFQYAYNNIYQFLSKKLKQKKLYFSSKFDIIKMKIRKARITKHEKNKKSKKGNI